MSVDILKDKIVKTRKEHNCYGCDRSFPKCSELLNVISVTDGVIHSSYYCEVCQSFLRNQVADNEYIICNLLSDFAEWKELRKEIEE